MNTLSPEIQALVDYIRDETGYRGEIGADDDLLEAGVLDSFNIVSLAMFAQERFGVEFDGEDLVRDNLARLSSLVALVHRRRV
ncbi:MAG: acyl carrier protein [Aquincola sp.]|nr:acyl carrier protein [Aquincola sp.]